MEKWQGRLGRRKKQDSEWKLKGRLKEGEAGFQNQTAHTLPSHRCPHPWRGDEQNSTRLTGLWWGLNLVKLSWCSGSTVSSGTLWVLVEVSWGAQTSRVSTGERRREDCRCRNNVNKGLGRGFGPTQWGGAGCCKHKKHGKAMNRDQSETGLKNSTRRALHAS